jgi:hypothetical protein
VGDPAPFVYDWIIGDATMKKTLVLLVLPLLTLAACASRTAGEEITRKRAIEIARQHLEFEARSTEAEKVTDAGRPVWRVTFKGRPPEEGGVGEVLVVNIDRKTGEMVSIGMS